MVDKSAVAVLGIYAYDGTAPGWAERAKDLVPVNEAIADYTFRRNRFVSTAKVNPGTN